MSSKFISNIINMIISLSIQLRLLSFQEFKSIIQPNKSFEENLLELLKAEVNRRKELKFTQNIKFAGFPQIKTIDSFDMSDEWLPAVNVNIINDLLSCEFIDKKNDIIAIGPSGRGKTHLSIAIGYEAIKKGYKVLFKKADTMISEIAEAKSEKRLNLYINKINKADLLIIDELGYSIYNNDEANYLFRVISSRYEQRSTFITTNHIFTSWKEFITDELLLKALVDRLIHHSTIINMNSPTSYRFSHAHNRNVEIKESI